jgi:hypothetical protein
MARGECDMMHGLDWTCQFGASLLHPGDFCGLPTTLPAPAQLAQDSEDLAYLACLVLPV